jgi:hypothetical protein
VRSTWPKNLLDNPIHYFQHLWHWQYSDDEEPEAFGCDEESDSEINEHQQDDKFEVDEDIDISAAVLRSIIDSGIGKIAAQDSQASVSSSLMVEGDESFDWNTV